MTFRTRFHQATNFGSKGTATKVLNLMVESEILSRPNYSSVSRNIVDRKELTTYLAGVIEEVFDYTRYQQANSRSKESFRRGLASSLLDLVNTMDNDEFIFVQDKSREDFGSLEFRSIKGIGIMTYYDRSVAATENFKSGEEIKFPQRFSTVSNKDVVKEAIKKAAEKSAMLGSEAEIAADEALAPELPRSSRPF